MPGPASRRGASSSQAGSRPGPLSITTSRTCVRPCGRAPTSTPPFRVFCTALPTRLRRICSEQQRVGDDHRCWGRPHDQPQAAGHRERMAVRRHGAQQPLLAREVRPWLLAAPLDARQVEQAVEQAGHRLAGAIDLSGQLGDALAGPGRRDRLLPQGLVCSSSASMRSALSRLARAWLAEAMKRLRPAPPRSARRCAAQPGALQRGGRGRRIRPSASRDRRAEPRRRPRSAAPRTGSSRHR